MQVVPVLNVKPEVDMEILVVVIMEDTVRLPGLPPLRLQLGEISFSAEWLVRVGYLESNTRVVNDAVKIDIEQHETVHSWGTGRVGLL